jgi:transcriptional regulator with XRE-family HTH domain
MDFKIELRAARRQSGLSQEELAARAGVSRSAIVLLEGGKGSMRALAAVSPHLNFRPVGIGDGQRMAAQVRSARAKRRLTQAEVAAKAGVSIPTVRGIERGTGTVRSLQAVLAVVAPAARANAVFRSHWHVKEDVRLTPPEFIDEIVAAFGPVSIDVAAAPTGFVRADRYLYEADDGLRTRWSGGLAWCNPPFSKLSKWMNRCASAWEARETNAIVGLFPARTETVAFRTRIVGAADVLLLPRRLRFYDEARQQLAPSPFALMLCCWGVERALLERYVLATGSTPIWANH